MSAWSGSLRTSPSPSRRSLSASTPAGQEGCLEVTWDPKTLAAGTCRLFVYCEASPREAGQAAVPRATPDSEDGRAMLQSLDTGKPYQLAAIAVNADGKRSAPGPVARATVADRQAPRPGWIAAQAVQNGER